VALRSHALSPSGLPQRAKYFKDRSLLKSHQESHPKTSYQTKESGVATLHEHWESSRRRQNGAQTLLKGFVRYLVKLCVQIDDWPR
jgi:hypothetical protein